MYFVRFYNDLPDKKFFFTSRKDIAYFLLEEVPLAIKAVKKQVEKHKRIRIAYEQTIEPLVTKLLTEYLSSKQKLAIVEDILDFEKEHFHEYLSNKMLLDRLSKSLHALYKDDLEHSIVVTHIDEKVLPDYQNYFIGEMYART